ncbi:uncharacterized protein ATNIH1004_006169 [Aspergillus tanneri]|uniref:Uncharacterized protein n=1 Tax=Aspergillus tanneri TaxID=1220188 RepID=A0A5M9MNH3_9EURO|nr:uncharacterized protein ATNIH1004_006169 [Aspergillus tanneri]KAA8647476.1 hypothetical protein ATNIH1004_006169 [Aspergillus tanneri]
MKISRAASLLAATWVKCDYSCINVYQGIPDNSTVAPGSKIDIRFNRAPTSHCPDPLNKYAGGNYSLWPYNNPMRNRDTIAYDQSIEIQSDIPESQGVVTITIPENLPVVKDYSVWYLRLSTYLPDAPQG